MISEGNKNILNREELKNSGAYNFKHGDLVICGQYYIHIKYGNYSRPSMMTTVNTRYDFRDLPMRKHPQYIRNFIEKWSPEDERKYNN